MSIVLFNKKYAASLIISEKLQYQKYWSIVILLDLTLSKIEKHRSIIIYEAC